MYVRSAVINEGGQGWPSQLARRLPARNDEGASDRGMERTASAVTAVWARHRWRHASGGGSLGLRCNLAPGCVAAWIAISLPIATWV